MALLKTLLERLRYLLPALLVWGLLGLLGFALISAAPTVKRLTGVEVKARAEGSTLGWQELGQYPGASSAEKAHLRVTYDGKQQTWLLQNVAGQKHIDARTDKLKTRYVRRWALQAGDRLVSEHFTLEVLQSDSNGLTIRNVTTGVTGTWTGTELLLDGQSGHPNCEQSNVVKRWGIQARDYLQWTWFRDRLMDEKRLFTFGGQIDCTTRWAQLRQENDDKQVTRAEVKPDALRFFWMDQRFWVGSGVGYERVRIERGAAKLGDLNSVQLPAISKEDGTVDRLILGRTHFSLTTGKGYLALIPTANQAVFIQTDPHERPENSGLTPEEIKVKTESARLEEAASIKDMAERGIFPTYETHAWIGSIGNGTSKTNLAVAFGVTLLLASLVFTFRQGHHRLAHFVRLVGMGITLFLSCVSALLAGIGVSLGVLLLLAWLMALWATLVQLLSGRLLGYAARVWTLLLLLAGSGLLVATQLAAGSDNTRWLGFPVDAAFWLTQLAGWVALFALAPWENVLESLMKLLHPDQRWLIFGHSLPHWSYLLLVVLTLGLLLAQWLGGSEEGIWGIQPVELTKLVFVVAAARLLWFWHHIRVLLTAHYRENWLSIGVGLFAKMGMALVFGAAILVVGVHDNSPVFIVLCLSMALLWLAFIDPLDSKAWGKWMGRSVFILLPLMVVVSLAVWAYFDPPDYDSRFPQAERLRIWSNPLLYPEAATQLLNSLKRVGDGGWWGTGWFGKNGAAMSVPAVQDDFIAAFMLNRFGGIPGMVLITVQFFWLLTLFRLAALLQDIKARPEVEAAFRLMGYVLYGLAWLHLLHWLISWSNVLGLLPIMGQPMTWLSAGNSHLLAVGMPTLLLALLAGWVVQMNGRE
jgi:cell division protein FtsW (lipid II flippase)